MLTVTDAGGKQVRSYAYSSEGERLSYVDEKGTGYYYYDGRGSVSEEIKDNRTVYRLRYDGYGNITSYINTQNRIYGYDGEEYTPQTGLIYLSARNYDPLTGRFTTRDRYLG